MKFTMRNLEKISKEELHKIERLTQSLYENKRALSKIKKERAEIKEELQNLYNDLYVMGYEQNEIDEIIKDLKGKAETFQWCAGNLVVDYDLDFKFSHSIKSRYNLAEDKYERFIVYQYDQSQKNYYLIVDVDKGKQFGDKTHISKMSKEQGPFYLFKSRKAFDNFKPSKEFADGAEAYTEFIKLIKRAQI